MTGLVAAAGAALAQPPQHAPVPGGVAVVELPVTGEVRPSVRYRDRQALVVPGANGGWQAVLGIPLGTEPGEQTFFLARPDGSESRLHFQVEEKTYAESRITIADENMVTPDAEAMERIRRERPILRQAQERFSAVDDVPLAFDLPIRDRMTSAFGKRRFINDQPRNPHSGLDIAGATGTPINAPAGGEVIETGHFYFNGKTVFLDHGRGLISIFSHMNRIDVEPGQRVDQGEQLGTVGMTGRVTGPHLHWSVSLGNTKVNPRYFLTDAQPLEGDGE
jgi:murein DD-endopeptidase MepM/ murein hydrolase activator NlpD